MIRVVVTGSECTGKTTLARALAEHYNTAWVPEFVRQFVQAKGSAPDSSDVEAIAHGQIAQEDRLRATAPDLLIQDTDLISTVVYSRHYYSDCPSWIERAALERAAHLYLLTNTDVPWVADGEQRDRGDRREEMQDLFRRALQDHQLDFVEISGSPQERLLTAVTAIDPLLAG